MWTHILAPYNGVQSGKWKVDCGKWKCEVESGQWKVNGRGKRVESKQQTVAAACAWEVVVIIE